MSNQGLVRYKANDGSEVKLSPAIVARYIVTGGARIGDKEVYAFIAKCQSRGLNPLAGDCHLSVFNGKAQVIVSKDYFMRTAALQPTFDGIEAGVIVVDADGNLQYREGAFTLPTDQLVGGWATVYDRSRSHPSRAQVSMKEYDKKRSTWSQIPATMIRKVALVQALREAYPASYGGIYDADEMPDGVVPAQHVEQMQADPEPHPAIEEPQVQEEAMPEFGHAADEVIEEGESF